MNLVRFYIYDFVNLLVIFNLIRPLLIKIFLELKNIILKNTHKIFFCQKKKKNYQNFLWEVANRTTCYASSYEKNVFCWPPEERKNICWGNNPLSCWMDFFRQNLKRKNPCKKKTWKKKSKNWQKKKTWRKKSNFFEKKKKEVEKVCKMSENYQRHRWKMMFIHWKMSDLHTKYYCEINCYYQRKPLKNQVGSLK